MSFMQDHITSRTFLYFLLLSMLSEQGCIQDYYSGETPHLASRYFYSTVHCAHTCSPLKHSQPQHLYVCCFIEARGPCFPYQCLVHTSYLRNESFSLLSTAESMGRSHRKWPSQRKKLSTSIARFLLLGPQG